jgi:hypothetical protein
MITIDVCTAVACEQRSPDSSGSCRVGTSDVCFGYSGRCYTTCPTFTSAGTNNVYHFWLFVILKMLI